MSAPPPINDKTPSETPMAASDISKPASADTGILGTITDKLGLSGGRRRRRGRRLKTRRGGDGASEVKGLYTGFKNVNVTGGRRSRRSKRSRRAGRKSRKSRKSRK